MLRSFGLAASNLLAPQPDAVAQVRAALGADWRRAALELLAGGWREQVTAAAAIAVSGPPALIGAESPAADRSADASADPSADASADPSVALSATLSAALWRAIDGSSWVAPQLVAAALVADPEFEPRAAERLTAAVRRPPKTIGALVRAYNRCPARRMPVVAQLGVHDRTLATEEARIGVRGVDGWADYFGAISRSS